MTELRANIGTVNIFLMGAGFGSVHGNKPNNEQTDIDELEI